MRPAEANVGLDQFRINESPGKQSPVVNGKACETFLFAYADSTLQYALPKWAKSFSASGFSFQSQNVKFIVRCDGKTFYESNPLTEYPSNIARINVNLPQNSQMLELIAQSLTDNEQPQTAWCDPTLYSESIETRKLFREAKLKKEQSRYLPARYGLEITSEGCLALGLPNTIFTGNNATYELWMWPASQQQTGIVLWDGDDQWGKDREIIFSNGNIIAKGFADTPYDLVSKDQLRPQMWNYVAVTATNKSTIIYLNGKKTAEYAGRVASVIGCSAIYLGRGIYNGNFWGAQFQGLITDIRLWNRPLSAKEIADAYHRKTAQPEGLIGRWDFKKGEADSSVCNYHNSAIIGEAKIIRLKTLPKRPR